MAALQATLERSPLRGQVDPVPAARTVLVVLDRPPTDLVLADHPVIGGHPVLAVVRTADLPAPAQLRPGDVVRFRS